MAKDTFLEEKFRAEDILLGGLGFGGEAKIVEVQLKGKQYFGKGKFTDGEEFEFESEEEVTELEEWAINVLLKSK